MEQMMMNNTAMAGPERKALPDSPSSSSLSSIGNSSVSSLESECDPFEEVNSSSSSSSSSTSSSTDHPLAADPALDVSSLIQQLPIKRGLSKHYQGKSQSFTSLANVRCLEDLAKPENPYNKKLKMKACRKSYGGGIIGDTRISKSSRVSCSSISVKKGKL